MIDLDRYALSDSERIAIEEYLARVGSRLCLQKLWFLMDLAWKFHGCDNHFPSSDRIARFYRDPIWLLNGMFIEQDVESLKHRKAITSAVAVLSPKCVVDFGGGFGTLARMLASALPQAEILICEPFPPLHGIASCRQFANISYVPELISQSADVLVSTDVLEHVPDPLVLLAAMVDAVRPEGYLIIANCFYPVIACHLPCTFHLRYSFDTFCKAFGLQVVGSCDGSHATIYRRAHVLDPDWQRLRKMELRSESLFPWRERCARYINPWMIRSRLALTKPLHYPRKMLGTLLSRC